MPKYIKHDIFQINFSSSVKIFRVYLYIFKFERINVVHMAMTDIAEVFREIKKRKSLGFLTLRIATMICLPFNGIPMSSNSV
jgi:hypothetical protein